MHVIWLVFMVMMITHLFPNDKLSMALRKNKKETYVEVQRSRKKWVDKWLPLDVKC